MVSRTNTNLIVRVPSQQSAGKHEGGFSLLSWASISESVETSSATAGDKGLLPLIWHQGVPQT